MQPRALRFTAGAVLLAVVFFSLYQIHTPNTVADFAPTLLPQEAAARVQAAQHADAQQRLENVYATGDPGQPDSAPAVTTIYFSQTGHHLSNQGNFLNFWRANGQLLTFGYPITEAFFNEEGRLVQYFERVRLEHHPEYAGTEWEVQLGLLGNDLRDSGIGSGVPDPLNGVRYFPETQHTLYGDFHDYWNRRGDIQLFGFPITEEFNENGRVVQYFERARFEYNPGAMDPYYRNQESYYGFDLDTLYEVTLGDLGRQVALIRGIDMSAVPRQGSAPEWTPALWERRIDINLSTQWLTAYENDLVVYRAPVTTGRSGFDTPTGTYAVYDKVPMQTMQGSVGGESWYVPNIPWVMYIVGGVAMHGTYWHNYFGSGVRLSHGCINLPMDDAQWLYDWADVGTKVRVHY